MVADKQVPIAVGQTGQRCLNPDTTGGVGVNVIPNRRGAAVPYLDFPAGVAVEAALALADNHRIVGRRGSKPNPNGNRKVAGAKVNGGAVRDLNILARSR